MRTLALALTLFLPLPAIAEADDDHLLCFKIKDPLKLSGIVALSAEPDVQPLVPSGSCTLGTAQEYCRAVGADVVSATNRATGQPIDLLPVDGRPGPGDRVCYKLKCAAGAAAGREVSDRFGTRTLSRFRVSQLCTPAIAGPPPTTSTSTSTVPTTSNSTSSSATSSSTSTSSSWTGTSHSLTSSTAPNFTTSTHTTTSTTTSSSTSTIPGGRTIVQIIDASGDGVSALGTPTALAVDGNVYVAGSTPHNVFEITPPGVITELIDASGDGAGNTLEIPRDVAVHADGTVVVVGASNISNGPTSAFAITPAGVISEIIDETGDGLGNLLHLGLAVAVDPAGTTYVAGFTSRNVFAITPAGVASELIDRAGTGNRLSNAWTVAVGAGNVYVGGTFNAFEITPGGAVTQIIDETGDGSNGLQDARDIGVDAGGNVYVMGAWSHNVFKITPAGVITEIFDLGDGDGETARTLRAMAVTADGTVYVAANTNQAFEVTPAGVATEIISAAGDGLGHLLLDPSDIAVDSSGAVYVSGLTSRNVFKIVEP